MTPASDQILEEEPQQETAEPGLGELFGRLVRNARAYAGAEMELLQTTYVAKMRALRTSVLGLVVAALLSLAAIVALLVGLMMGFAPLIGPFAAAFAVSIVALAIAVVIGLASARTLRRQFKGRKDEAEEQQEEDREPEPAVTREEAYESAR